VSYYWCLIIVTTAVQTGSWTLF